MMNNTYTVFEVRNEKMREIYVGASTEPMFRIIKNMRLKRPAKLRHWSRADIGWFRSLAFGLEKRAAAERVRELARRIPPPGWRYLR